MNPDQVLEKGEQIESRYKFGDVEVIISNERVIVQEQDELKSMSLGDITDVVLVKGDTYRQKEGSLRKFIQWLGLLSPPEYPVQVKFKAALPTARRMKFMTSTKFEDSLDDFHTDVNLKVKRYDG